MIINYALIAINSKGELLHFCGYETKPTEVDIQNLTTELREDKEFGLTEEEFLVIEAPGNAVEEIFGSDRNTDDWEKNENP